MDEVETTELSLTSLTIQSSRDYRAIPHFTNHTKHSSAASDWQILSHSVVSSTLRNNSDSNSQHQW